MPVLPTPRARAVEAYHRRLQELDRLPDAAAIRLAGDISAGSCVYVLAAPQQVWVCTDEASPPDRLTIISVSCDSEVGHYALVQSESRAGKHVMPLDTLSARYALETWPDS